MRAEHKTPARRAGVLLFVLTAALVSSFSLPGNTEPTTIRVGISRDFPPYEFVNERGVADGYDVDIIRAAAEAMAVEVAFTPGPWSEIREALEDGRLDAVPGMLYSKQRDHRVDFSLPHTIIHYAIFVRIDNEDIAKEADLRDKSIVVERGSLMHDRLKRSGVTDRLIEAETEPEAIRMLASGQYDAAIAPKIQGMLLIRDEGIHNVRPVGAPVYSAKLCFAVQEGNHDLRVLLDGGLNLILSSGRYDEIYDKWFRVVDPRVRPGWIAKYGLYLLIFIGFLLLGAVIGYRYLHRLVAARTRDLSRYTAILDATSDLVSMATPEGKLLFLNEAGRRMLGFSGEKVTRAEVPDVHPTWASRLVAETGFPTAARDGIWTSENAVLSADGREIPVSQVIMSHKSENGAVEYFSTIMRDISAQKASEAELLRREAILRALARLAQRLLRSGSWGEAMGESLETLGAATAVDRTYIFQNHEDREGNLLMSQRFEWSAEGVSAEIDNPDLQDLPYDASGMSALRQKLSRGEAFHGIVRELPREIAEVLEPQGILSIVLVPINVGDAWWGFLGFDDCHTEHPWSVTEIDVLKAAAGMLGSAIQRSQTEGLLREAEQQMFRADKMAALGQIIAGVAHEINNPNNFIFFNLPILRRYIDAMQELLDAHVDEIGEIRILHMSYEEFLLDVSKLLQNMEHGSKRITGIVADLKNYVRSEEDQEMKPGDLAAVIDNVMTLIGKQVRKTVKRLDVETPDALPAVRMNPGKIEQVLINLVINAGQAADKEDSWIKISASAPVDDRVVIEVADNGSGIPKDIINKVFDPFFTSKGREEGTGLGLSISHRIIEDHGGTLTVVSVKGEGTTFTIELPTEKT